MDKQTRTREQSNETRVGLRGIIVEKTVIDMASGKRTEFFALCSSEPQPNSLKYSLTFEGYITGWTKDRNSLQ